MKDFYPLLKKYVKPQLFPVLLSLAILLIYTLTNIATPTVMQYFVDKIIVNKQIKLFSHYAILIAIILLVASTTGLLSNYLLVKTFEQISKDMKAGLYRKIAKRDLRFFSKNKSGEINYRIFNDSDVVQQFFYVLLVNIPNIIITLIVVGVLMIKINIYLSLFVFSVFILLSILTKIVNKPIINLTKQQRINLQFANGIITELAKMIKLIRGMGMNQISFTKVDQNLNLVKRINIKTNVFNKWVSVIFNVINNTWALIALWYGGQLAVEGKITLGLLLAFLMYANMLYPQINALFSSIISFQQVKVSAERYNEYYNNDENEQAKKKNGNKIVNGLVTFDNVSFSYNDKSVISKLSCNFMPNEITVIRGENGSGKSTLCAILKKFYSGYTGNITIDNIDLEELSDKEINNNIRYLPQDEFILSGTINENLCLDNVNISSSDKLFALEKVGLRQFVENLPEGLNTQVGESGSQLSGGQRQRIALARLLLSKSKIVILDEPTAFVDSRTESMIYSCLNDLKKHATVIVVLHSESSMKIADKILNMDDISSSIEITKPNLNCSNQITEIPETEQQVNSSV